MRALAVDTDVIVFVSRVWQTTCTALRVGDEGFLIDSPVYPDELEALPAVLEQARFPVSGLLATHADWDHLLARLVFPEASLGCGEATGRRLAAEPGAAQRSLRAFDEEHYVEGRRPLALAGVQSLPVPGHLALGPEHELELHPASGHTADGTVFWIPWTRVLVCGDYLSPVEIPMLSPGGSLEAYLDTLERLRPLVAAAGTVVPGHGAPQPSAEATRVLDEDLAYLQALNAQGDAPLPAGRKSPAQRKIHAENADRVGSA
ncbi:MAG: MBL fold metallo-hydrolase [Actinomycetota bacterium]|nr:MBL fold metallo-hydrolase [Actinomycetota bacterium]